MTMEYDEAVKIILALPPVQIQETEFKRYLPLFAYRPDNTEPLPVADWVLNVAQSPFAEVAVYNGKAYLFTVPPLLARNDILDNISTVVNINDVITQAKLKSDVHENLGESHIRDNLLNRLPARPTMNLSIALRWNEIFKRYNMTLIPVGKHPVVGQPPAAQAIYDGYEEL